MTLIISAFPGTGKTHAFYTQNELGIRIKDSDSSLFPKDNFPNNYIEHIKEVVMSGEFDIILVSSHEAVRHALAEHNLKYILVYPVGLKEEYLKRYEERGSSEAFIQLLSDNWIDWVNSCKNDTKASLVYELMTAEQYLTDVIRSTISEYDDLRNTADTIQTQVKVEKPIKFPKPSLNVKSKEDLSTLHKERRTLSPGTLVGVRDPNSVYVYLGDGTWSRYSKN